MIVTTLQISCLKKMMKGSTRGQKNTRKCIIKVGVQIVILDEMLPLSFDIRHDHTLLEPSEFLF